MKETSTEVSPYRYYLQSLQRAIANLRVDYQLLFRDRRQRDAAAARAQIHFQLSLLTPLCRALHAAVQQTAPGRRGSGVGQELYIKKFGVFLQALWRWAEEPTQLSQLFKNQVAGTYLLVPAQGVDIVAWVPKSIDELVRDARTAAAAKQADHVRRCLAARDAELAFYGSLGPEQLALLRVALDLAEGTGRFAVSFSKRELEQAEAKRGILTRG